MPATREDYQAERDRSGEGGPVDLAEARRLYGLAAAQGDANAQYILGFMHRSGEGGPVDLVEAKRLFGLATSQGLPKACPRLAQAHVLLGNMLVNGEGGPKDFANLAWPARAGLLGP